MSELTEEKLLYIEGLFSQRRGYDGVAEDFVKALTAEIRRLREERDEARQAASEIFNASGKCVGVDFAAVKQQYPWVKDEADA